MAPVDYTELANSSLSLLSNPSNAAAFANAVLCSALHAGMISDSHSLPFHSYSLPYSRFPIATYFYYRSHSLHHVHSDSRGISIREIGTKLPLENEPRENVINHQLRISIPMQTFSVFDTLLCTTLAEIKQCTLTPPSRGIFFIHTKVTELNSNQILSRFDSGVTRWREG